MLGRSAPDAKTIALEERQLTMCRGGALFLAAGLVAQMFINFTQLFESTSVSDVSEFKTPALSFYLFNGAVLLMAFVPGAGMLLRSARSRRWRLAAAGLTLLFLIEMVLVVVLSRIMPLDEKITLPAPMPARIVFHASAVISWLEFWWIAVLIAEFALACRAQLLVVQTERLGYTILVGLIFELTVGLAGLMLPFNPTTSNELFVFAEACREIALAVTVAWTIYLLAMTAALARLLAERCGDLQPTDAKPQS